MVKEEPTPKTAREPNLSAGKSLQGFTKEEPAAMRERANELKSAASEGEVLAAEKRIIENVKSGKRSMQ